MGKRINYKIIFTKIYLVSIAIVFTNCASSQKVESTAPVQLKDPYFQNWVSGIEGGGAGFMVYLPIDEKSDVQLEEIYFKGKRVKLKRKRSEAVYTGRYTNPKTVRKEIVMSGDPKEEYDNQVQEIEEKIPFDLKNGESVIAYSKNGKKGYFKLDKLPEKELKGYPMQSRQ